METKTTGVDEASLKPFFVEALARAEQAAAEAAKAPPRNNPEPP